ncbi:hypothetical protein B0H19DRAFT_1089922 [Mycena capillaripes]|nr:hypothetical protein B0H19DRAFT_1203988 [Mycena capillaripes]KAJ6593347.1 hypothetical protein B0H19DRAFT_1089922 [Mycena capillaripes]
MRCALLGCTTAAAILVISAWINLHVHAGKIRDMLASTRRSGLGVCSTARVPCSGLFVYLNHATFESRWRSRR